MDQDQTAIEFVLMEPLHFVTGKIMRHLPIMVLVHYHQIRKKISGAFIIHK